MLDKDYSKLQEMEIKGYSRTKMAMELLVSESKLDTMIKNLKKKIKKFYKKHERTQGNLSLFLCHNLIMKRKIRPNRLSLKH
jgi:hypothetical protein